MKTKNAYRTLLLVEDTVSALLEQKKKVGSNPWAFPSPNGGPISPDSVLHMLHRVLKRAGLPKVRFHDLRHFFATLALQNGGTSRQCLACWALLRWVHSGHLRSRHQRRPAESSTDDRQCPLRCSIDLSGPFRIWVAVWVKHNFCLFVYVDKLCLLSYIYSDPVVRFGYSI